MHSFVYGILGGGLIGLSASVLLLFAGDILGASGIVNSIFLNPRTTLYDPCQHWKLVLLSSFTLTARIFFADIYTDKDNGLASISPAAFAIGGFFVGFGTKLGNGCTSGHGICGLARLSKRSFVAVCTFMATGILTAYLTQEQTTPFKKSVFVFLRSSTEDPIKVWNELSAIIVFFLCLAAFIAPSFHTDPSSNCRTKLAPAATAAVLFSVGLYVSRMTFPTVVLGFLNLGLFERGGDNWDPTLIFVMGAGATISFLSYQLVEGYNVLGIFQGKTIRKPLSLSEGSSFCVPNNSVIDGDLVLGAASFGIGWGLTGLCPGPAMFLASVGISWVVVCYWPAFFAGSFLATRIKERRAGCRANQQQLRQVAAEACTTNKCQKNGSQQGSTGVLSVENRSSVGEYGSA